MNYSINTKYRRREMKSFMEVLIKERYPAAELLACLATWYVCLPKHMAYSLNTVKKNMINTANRRTSYRKSL